ncbi:UDP-glucose:undecaprenyl-phosphate glucose-1-phosphate transferase [Kordia antarctica]|uniref:UDP-glucose:undecaprenyl-phosphate glucose-1-phosphate transferase n=1 Tax=Kordia antarctica TaxID=1218801 RepID=A0A7L4ZNG2_9FLAO|nr:exopolysaccharide biosynthesis polyprenyl glycosylphosphotransferase [Kordia antarctica]QHI37444.1 UDP-glucose:undecaprenyl-phosphate glucose-1-phosphate transferase [Kordia antarctica]
MRTKGRYSWLLRPFFVVFDLCVINILVFWFFDFNDQDLYFFDSSFWNNKHLLFILYTIIFWPLSSIYLKFYNVYRFTSIPHILSLLIKQLLAYTLIMYAFIGIFRSIDVQAFVTFKYLLLSFGIIGLGKIIGYYGLKKYRAVLDGNIRRVIIIGYNSGAQELERLFKNNKELGYKISGIFSDKKSEAITGTIEESFHFIEKEQGIDEIYCAIDELSEKHVNDYVKYASLNMINIKFIPNTKKLVTKRLKTDYYNYLPILSIQEVALNNNLNRFIKRAFDIAFSLFIIIFLLSWFIPLMAILIKLESKGPVFYKHIRNGMNYKEFTCYKFRSLNYDKDSDLKQVEEEDSRVTKIGRFIRKTSIDELPQFFNVLKGDMSVIGPRPHMIPYTSQYAKKIDKYNFVFRHSVKPGISGLAQVKGYRGEIKNDEDIINRIKYDIFYIENWSLFLDIKIIFETIANILKGEKKAY